VDVAIQHATIATSAAVEGAVRALPISLQAEATSILRQNAPAEAAALLSAHVSASTAQSVVAAVAVASRAAVAVAVATALPTVDESIESAVAGRAPEAGAALHRLAGNQPDVQELVRRRISTGLGTRLESTGLDKLQRDSGVAVTARNAQGFSLRLLAADGRAFTLYGKIDGLQADVVVEHKQRRNQLFGRLVRRERIQLLVYLALTKRTKGVLVETFGASQTRHHLEFDAVEWSSLRQRLGDAVAELHAVMRGADEAPRAALLRLVLE